MSQWAHLYKTARWHHERADFLRRNRLCLRCQTEHRRRLATTVDHKIPHRGDLELFWDQRNWEPICDSHHNRFKQAEEHGHLLSGCDASGIPSDPRHPWKK